MHISCGLIIYYFQVDINHVDEIDEIFDAISYRKGASVIRMLQSYLGAEVLQVWFSYSLLSSFCLSRKKMHSLKK